MCLFHTIFAAAFSEDTNRQHNNDWLRHVRADGSGSQPLAQHGSAPRTPAPEEFLNVHEGAYATDAKDGSGKYNTVEVLEAVFARSDVDHRWRKDIVETDGVVYVERAARQRCYGQLLCGAFFLLSGLRVSCSLRLVVDGLRAFIRA